MAARRGGPFGERLEIVRASSSVMRQYMNALHRAVDEANLAATHAKGEYTALFLIEGRVRRLLPFQAHRPGAGAEGPLTQAPLSSIIEEWPNASPFCPSSA